MAIALSCLSGTLLFLSFPKYNLWPAAWIALVPLFLILFRSPHKPAFWYSWLAGTVYFLGSIYWVTHTMVVYGQLPLPLSLLFMLLLVVYLGLYVGLFGFLYARFIRTLPTLLQLLAAPSAWVTLEWIRTYFLTGFPWALLGYSQYSVLPVIQVADLAGVYGVSFLVVLINLALAQTLQSFIPLPESPKPPRPWSSVAYALIGTSLVLVYGFTKLSHYQETRDATIKVGLIQGNIEQDLKWDPDYQVETLQIYKDLTRQALAAGAAPTEGLDLVVWPETATPFFFEIEREYKEELIEFISQQQTPLLFGSPALGQKRQGGQTQPVLFNSAYLLARDGTLTDRYDKIHLVPFGEYVPFATLLSFVHKMVEGIGDFGSGKEFTVMAIPEGRFGVVICFEVIFPDLVRQFVKNGAQFMTTLTNDAWFGDSSAPYQHFSMVVFRAVENRVPFIRAANTGITGSIDATGRIQAASPLFTKTFLIQEIGFSKGKTTFYARYGDLFAYLCGIIALVATGYRFAAEQTARQRS